MHPTAGQRRCTAAGDHGVIPLKTETDQSIRSIRFRRMQIPLIVLMFMVSVAPIVQAEPYEVLVVDIAGANDVPIPSNSQFKL